MGKTMVFITPWSFPKLFGKFLGRPLAAHGYVKGRDVTIDSSNGSFGGGALKNYLLNERKLILEGHGDTPIFH